MTQIVRIAATGRRESMPIAIHHDVSEEAAIIQKNATTQTLAYASGIRPIPR
ncbi:MAG: hypothetical protein ACFB8W_25320 [Elainellaceae cyanobacterium]